MSLTVLNVAYPLARVAPDTAGGAEQIVRLIDRALVEAGHRSIVVAAEGSLVAGTLVPTPVPAGMLDSPARERAQDAHRAAIEEALAGWKIDLVHLHGIDFHAYLPPPGVPVLATVHLPPSWYPPEVFSLGRPRTWLQCVSRSSERACPPCAHLLETIENGVPLPDDSPGRRALRPRYVVAFGRICPEKGFHIALDAARAAGRPLLLAGEVYRYPEHVRYFEDEILPRLDASRRFLGALGDGRRDRLLARAECLLAPSVAQETSSLVAMEALARGVPVVAFPSGALADIVEHRRTGFLVRDTAEMAEAIARIGEIDPECCRRTARRRFSAARMTSEYLALYERLARAEELT